MTLEILNSVLKNSFVFSEMDSLTMKHLIISEISLILLWLYFLKNELILIGYFNRNFEFINLKEQYVILQLLSAYITKFLEPKEHRSGPERYI